MSKYVGLTRGKVHDEHISSEYYCGGCGWPVTDHDSYCPECGGAFQESFEPDGERCPNCGAVFAVWGMAGADMVDDDVIPTEQEALAYFCPFCGEALR